MALRCLTLSERNLRRQQNKLAVIKSAEKKTILIQPISEVVISGYMDRKLPYHPVCALIQPTKRSSGQHNGQKKKYKMKNNDLQNIHIKLQIK